VHSLTARLTGTSLALLFAGCQASSPPGETTPASKAAEHGPIVSARFDCDTMAVTATFRDEQVVLDLPDRTVTLPRTSSASGARFATESMSFWSKGRDATLVTSGRTETCRERREPWQEATDRGVEFRAFGEEPGWFLEIDRDHGLRLVYDYAEHDISFASQAPTVSDRTKTYEATRGSHRIRVTIEDRSCNDTLSGEGFPAVVVVALDHRTLKGCGRNLASH